VPRTDENRLETVFITEPETTAMLANLVRVDGIHNDARQPRGFGGSRSQRLLGQLAEDVAVLLRGPARRFEGSLGRRVVRCQQHPAVRLDREHGVARLTMQPVGHHCGSFNPPTAIRCDCGWDFASGTIKESYLHAKATLAASANLAELSDRRGGQALDSAVALGA